MPFNPIPTGHGRNQPIYERHVTKSGRNRVKAENEGGEHSRNSSQNDENKSGQNSEATIEEIFDNIQKEILARKVIRDEAILH